MENSLGDEENIDKILNDLENGEEIQTRLTRPHPIPRYQTNI